MTTYADPSRCPDCRSVLPPSPQVCRHCALPLTGPTAVELFTTLQRADRLVAVLRQQAAAPQPVAAGAVTSVPSGSLLTDAAPYPAPRPPEDLDAPRLRGTSVPKILLTLGALCLLVAAVTFLAVAWSWLGVGGRTVVLLALTAGSLGSAQALTRRGLRTAAEALTVVGLGLVALDVVGARHAGWLGQVTDAGLVAVAGSVVATVALAVLVTTAPRPLVAPALLASFAVLVAGFGAQWHVDAPVALLVATLVLLGLVRLGVELPSTPLTVTSLTAGAVGWLYVVTSGLDRATNDQTVAHLWGHLAIWPLLAATALAAATGPACGLKRVGTLAGWSVAGLLGTYVGVLAALDNSLTDATLSLLPCVVLWAALVVAAPERLRPAAVLPLAGSLVVPVAVLVDLAATAARATLQVGDPFSRPLGVHVAASSPWAAAWPAAPTAAVVAGAACAFASVLASPLRRTTWPAAVGAAALAGAAISLPLYDVPLAAVVGVLLAFAAAGFLGAERLDCVRAGWLRGVAAAPVLLAVAAALPNAALTTIVLALATALTVHLMRRTDLTGDVATAAFTAAFGGLVWAAGEVLAVPQVDRAVPVLLVLGGLALWRPEPVLETGAALVGAVVSGGAVLAAADTSWALAIHLTVAGALVTATSLLHPGRRGLAWAGGLLLAMATWVRLSELGVTVPEAYTLPSALVLVAIGVWRLHRDDDGLTLRLLAPGLTLATVPSLLAALADPVSLRALLLGLGCLGLVLAGTALRWGAPLVIGGLVGAALVLRELAPYAAALPPWVVIGLSGTLLTVVGVTWESRMRDLRTASTYVARMR